METETLKIIWSIVENGGGIGILFVTNVFLWIKIDKKDQKIYELIEKLSELNTAQIQTNKTLDNLSGTLIQFLTNKK